jgi:hypothetical protein
VNYAFFVRDRTPVAIGNETDMLHPSSTDYLLGLLAELGGIGLQNPIILVTKAPLSHELIQSLRSAAAMRLVFFLSYSGLGRQLEPNFTDEQLRRNFSVAKAYDFPVVHYWRPLMPENTTLSAVSRMLSFVSATADATVFTGLKLHPELTRIITHDGALAVPDQVRDHTGEWLESQTVQMIYREANRIAPNYPLYRHASCALAFVLQRPDHTGTVYREDICPPSHCPSGQRLICAAARRIPSENEIARVLSALRRFIGFKREPDKVILNGEVTQQEFAYLLHNLNCPILVEAVRMQNLYHGSIYLGQRKTD